MRAEIAALTARLVASESKAAALAELCDALARVHAGLDAGERASRRRQALRLWLENAGKRRPR